MAEAYLRQGRWRWGGGGGYLFGSLPLGVEDGDIPGDRFSGSSAYHGTAERIFHVQALYLTDSGGARIEGASALLQPV